MQRRSDGVSLNAELSTDCLFLNVWAPSNAHDLPVVVYFFGGGFEHGSASSPWCDGAELAAKADCVVVTANYRLGTFGFGSLPVSGGQLAAAHNLGVQDARAALWWTAKHIDRFGGDPAQLTVMGQSAGGFLAAAVAVAPDVPPIRGLACFSGGASRVVAEEDAAEFGRRILHELGVEGQSDRIVTTEPAEIVSAQRRVAPTAIATRNGARPSGFGVALDAARTDAVVPVHPMDAVASGALRDTFILSSAALDEADGFAPDAVDLDGVALPEAVGRLIGGDPGDLLDAYPAGIEGWHRVLTDYVYRLPAARLVQEQVRAGGRAALLDVTRDGTDLAPHGVETSGVFGRKEDPRSAAAFTVLRELIQEGSVTGGTIEDPRIAGDALPADVLAPSGLLNVWEGVPRP